jgi:hypothetical protein
MLSKLAESKLGDARERARIALLESLRGPRRPPPRASARR